METKEKFKDFVKENPRLLKFVKSGEMSWQKFYEMYDMYGDKEEVWQDYLKEQPTNNRTASTIESAGMAGSIGEIMNFIKNIDLDSVQNGVNSLQRVLGVLQEEYKPRPLYKHFED